MSERYDAVIVGGGIAGSGLATMLARGGNRVLVLEKSEQYEDMVRGEWLAPWGVIDARRAGVFDALAAANDHHITYHTEYGEGIDAAEADAQRLDMSGFLPGVAGPLAVGHPQACQALTDAAAAAGTTVVRGVSEVALEPGREPQISYRTNGERMTAAARIVIGADGRGSAIRRQAGITLTQEPTHHMFTGLLVHDAHGWPAELQCIATEGDVQIFVFPQAKGRVRLYISFPVSQKTRFSGPEGPQRFLDAYRLENLPGAEAIYGATIAGPCHTIPNQAAYTDAIVAPGVALIGDAAGYSDPITGQGLAIAMRDIRLVGEALLEAKEWDPLMALREYCDERPERMRRLGVASRISALLQAEFGPEAMARKLRFRAAAVADPTLGMARFATMVGPENVPSEAFSEDEFARVTAV